VIFLSSRQTCWSSRRGRARRHPTVIVARPELDELVRQGHIAPESRVDVMKSGVGVAVRAGAPKPDLGWRGAEKDPARRRLQRTERRAYGRDVPAHGHCGADQGKAKTNASGRPGCGNHREQRGRDRVSAVERAHPSLASLSLAPCLPMCRRSRFLPPAFILKRASRRRRTTSWNILLRRPPHPSSESTAWT